MSPLHGVVQRGLWISPEDIALPREKGALTKTILDLLVLSHAYAQEGNQQRAVRIEEDIIEHLKTELEVDVQPVFQAAVAAKRGKVVRFCMDKEVDVNAADPWGIRPLFHLFPDHELSLSLIEHPDLRINEPIVPFSNPASLLWMKVAPSCYGMFPLHGAVYWDCPAVLKKLVEKAGIDLECKNEKGQTPRELALNLGRIGCATLLLDAAQGLANKA